MNGYNNHDPFQPASNPGASRPFPAERWQQQQLQPFGPMQPYPPQQIEPEAPAAPGKTGQAAPPLPNAGQAQKLSSFHNTPPPALSSSSQRPKNRRVVILGAAIAIIILLGGVLYAFWKTTNTAADVTLYQVSTQNANQYVGGGGLIYPKQQLDISYPVVERVISVFVKPGDHVTSNEALIQLDPAQLNAQIQEAANEEAAAQAYLNSISGSANPATIAQAQQDYNVAKGKYDALVSELSSFTLHNGKLVSPLSGVVTAVNVDPGEIFSANSPLITIMDESTVIVRVQVPLLSLGQVHVGQPAVVTPSALPDLNINGTVSTIIPQANPQTDTFEVWVAVPNPDGTLLPGMSAFVRIQKQNRAYVLPRLAVLNPDRESIVFIVRDQHAYIQKVHVVGRSATSVYVDSGLSRGDQVVLVGLNIVQNGQKVRVINIEHGAGSASSSGEVEGK